MQGKVKSFSSDKGYGLIIGPDDQEYYFNVSDTRGPLPSIGATVTFITTRGNMAGKAKATAVSMVQKAHAPAYTQEGPEAPDDRPICQGCGKPMVPRIIIKKGRPMSSVCPNCGATYQVINRCFIASAVYGDADAPEVMALREFRDQVLVNSIIGRWFIRSYYRVSPPIADYLIQHPRAAAVVKPLLDALARRRGK